DPVAALETALAQAERHLAENEMDAAESDFRTALLEGWLLLAGLESADGDLEAAGEAFLRAQNSASETRRPRTGRALVALRQGRHEEAIGLLRKVLLGAPDSGELRRLLAQALIAADRHAEAVQELEEALARAPEDLETAFALGSGYLRVGDVEKARELLERLAAERPIPQTHILIGRTYRDFQQWDLA
ncbi:MAG: tetratricopeptide repeat protein, partial [Gammaproteobacteria bacterium]|nr:tetratricopeptide repeat protein [Gammaproteobacteria bacterium]